MPARQRGGTQVHAPMEAARCWHWYRDPGIVTPPKLPGRWPFFGSASQAFMPGNIVTHLPSRDGRGDGTCRGLGSSRADRGRKGLQATKVAGECSERLVCNACLAAGLYWAAMHCRDYTPVNGNNPIGTPLACASDEAMALLTALALAEAPAAAPPPPGAGAGAGAGAPAGAGAGAGAGVGAGAGAGAAVVVETRPAAVVPASPAGAGAVTCSSRRLSWASGSGERGKERFSGGKSPARSQLATRTKGESLERKVAAWAQLPGSHVLVRLGSAGGRGAAILGCRGVCAQPKPWTACAALASGWQAVERQTEGGTHRRPPPGSSSRAPAERSGRAPWPQAAELKADTNAIPAVRGHFDEACAPAGARSAAATAAADKPNRQPNSSLGSLSHCHTAVYSTYACDVRQRWLGLARQEGRLGQQKLGSKS